MHPRSNARRSGAPGDVDQRPPFSETVRGFSLGEVLALMTIVAVLGAVVALSVSAIV